MGAINFHLLLLVIDTLKLDYLAVRQYALRAICYYIPEISGNVGRLTIIIRYRCDKQILRGVSPRDPDRIL